jgi:hypothetical protein
MILPFLLLCLQSPSCLDVAASGRCASAPQAAPDLSDFLDVLLAVEGAGGFDSNDPRRGTSFGGVKIGMAAELKGHPPADVLRTMTFDFGYDRMQGRDGLSAEVSMMLPVARFPAPRTPAATYARIYFEPGGGFRFGAGDFGGYASAKAMVALFSDNRLGLNAPNVFFEIQRRFPFAAPVHGDTRVVVGLMLALCNHCGLD